MTDIVPEDFDLTDALRQRSTTPDDERKRCPDCGSVKILPKTDRYEMECAVDTAYLCDDCRTHFDEPVTGYTSAQEVRDDD